MSSNNTKIIIQKVEERISKAEYDPALIESCRNDVKEGMKLIETNESLSECAFERTDLLLMEDALKLIRKRLLLDFKRKPSSTLSTISSICKMVSSVPTHKGWTSNGAYPPTVYGKDPDDPLDLFTGC